MASKKSHEAELPEALAELESRGESVMEWIGENAVLVIGAVAAVLVVAAGIGLMQSWQSDAEAEAANALAKARDAYLVAMGAAPGALEVPELANPAAGAAIRDEYGKRFAAVAEEHAGTTAAAMARLEQGNLLARTGDNAGALEIWRASVVELPSGDPFAGVLQTRIAQVLEEDGDWVAAAEAHTAAGEIAAYPFRHWALAEAARCFVKADRPKAALELYTRIQAEAPELVLPDHLRIQLRELELRNPG